VNERETQWADLMRAANAGDGAAYARLLRELTPVLRSTARRGLTRSGQPVADAEDVVQETLIAIHLKRHTWDDGLPISPWVAAIARNKLIDALRRRNRRVSVPIDDFADTLAADGPSPEPAARDVDRHVDALPDRQRTVVRAIAIEGASISEAATQLTMTEGAVRVALHRGLAALYAKFGQ
jgi:RNA polymerase sigma-70 factor (ECF subfamily)